MNRTIPVVALILALSHPCVGRAIDCCGIQFVRQSDGASIQMVTPFGVSRRTPEGELDTHFGVDGFSEPVDGLPTGTRPPRAVAVQSDDKIVVATIRDTSPPFGLLQFVVVRYDADGSVDTEFGEGGVALSGPFDDPDDFAGIAVRPGGGVALVTTGEVAPDEPRYVLAVFSDVGPDATFGDPIIEFGEARDVGVQADGKIVVVVGGSTQFNEFAVLRRYDTDGSRDESFGSGGSASVDVGPAGDSLHALVIQPDGKLVAAGSAGVDVLPPLSDILTDLLVVRLLPADGAFDETFGEEGKRVTSLGGRFESIRQLIIDCDGGLLASGRSASPSDEEEGLGEILVRYTSSGEVDGSFGTEGISRCGFASDQCTPLAPCRTSTTSTASVTSTTTSTTTLPAGGCSTPCEDGDPCTADACGGQQCVFTRLDGAAGLGCLCESDAIETCRQVGLLPGILGQIDRACLLLGKLPGAGDKKSRKILGKALRGWQKAARLLDRPKKAAKVAAECRDPLAPLLADATSRVEAARSAR